jgi:integrase/transcriptional regulator with XRE-family HTH domain
VERGSKLEAKVKNEGASPALSVDEITDPGSLATRLQKAEDRVSQFLLGRLSEETRTMLIAYSGNGSGAEMLSTALAAEFTAVILGDSIYQEHRFAGVVLSKKTRQSLGRNLKGEAVKRFNRLLIEDAYPHEIANRYSKAKKQIRIRVGPNLFRIEGVKGIYGKIGINGKTYTPTLGTDDPKEARKAFEKWVVRKRESLKLSSAEQDTLASFVEPFLKSREDEVRLGNLKQVTLDNQRSTFHHISLHWKGFRTLSVSRITPKAMVGIGKFLLTKARSLLRPGKTLSPSTYNTFMSALGSLLRFLRDRAKITEELYLQLINAINYATVTPRKVKIPTASELKTIREHLYRVRQGPSRGEPGPKFDFMMLTGARLASVNASKVEHYDPVNRTLLLTNLKGKLKTKAPTEKRVPVCDELAEILDRLIKARNLKPGDPFFKTKSSNRAFASAAKAAGLAGWYHHACRHWFGTTALHQTQDPVKTADLLCHNDGGITLLKVYRQVCAEYLQATVRPLKLYPGASADSSLKAAIARAQKAVTKFGYLAPAQAAVVIDRILWIENRVDAADIQAVARLPGLAQENPPIYTRSTARVAERPSPTLLRNNLKHLVKSKGVYYSDISAALGIPRSTIAGACKHGDLQAAYIPGLCKYFNVTPEELLGCNLASSAPVQEASPPQAESEGIAADGPASPSADTKAEKTAAEIITHQDPAELVRTIARNLSSMLFERNMTAHELGLKTGLGAACYRFLSERFVPRDDTLTRLAKALEVAETEIVDPRRDNIVVNPPVLIANLKAIIAHSGCASATYFVRCLRLDSRTMHEVLATGQISALQAHRIVEVEGNKFSVRQLISEDLTAMFPPAPVLDPIVVSRNFTSICWERGLYPAEIAKAASVSATSAVNYAEGRSRRINREMLTKVAQALGLTLTELVDPSRPEVKQTPFFTTNLQFVMDLSGLALTPFGEACGLEHRAMRSLLQGHELNPHRIAKLVKFANQFTKLSAGELLMEDLRCKAPATHTQNPPDANPVVSPTPCAAIAHRNAGTRCLSGEPLKPSGAVMAAKPNPQAGEAEYGVVQDQVLHPAS